MGASDELVTDHDRHLVSVHLFYGESKIRAAFQRMDPERRYALFDQYSDLADKVPKLPGGLTPARRLVRDSLMDFAYRLSDIACDYLERLRYRVPEYWPPYGAELARARRTGKVPAAINGVHVAVALRFRYRRAAPGAGIVVEESPEFERCDDDKSSRIEKLEAALCRPDVQRVIAASERRERTKARRYRLIRELAGHLKPGHPSHTIALFERIFAGQVEPPAGAEAIVADLRQEYPGGPSPNTVRTALQKFQSCC